MIMVFVDVQHDEAAARDVDSMLTFESTLDTIAMWATIVALAYQILVIFLAWSGGVADLNQSGSCWWQLCGVGWKNCQDGRTSCRRNRHFQCKRRRNRRRSKQGKPWDCTLTSFHNQFCTMPPPLPLHRHRRGKCTEPESDASSTTTSQDTQIQEVSTEPAGNSLQKKSPMTRSITSNPPVTHTSVIDLARMQQWSRLIDRVTSHRREARQIDGDGLMPLHWACSGGPPVEVIEALLKAHPRASKRTDNSDSTALHFACHYGASASVVQVLLNAYPQTVYQKDKYGRTPLYHAVNKSSSLDVIRVLVEADPSMTIEPCLPTKSSYQHNSAKSTDSRPLHHRTPLFLAWSAVASTSPHTRRRRRNGKVWEKAHLLLEAAYCQVSTSKRLKSRKQCTYQMLHAVIMLDSYLPPHAIHLALERHPEQLRQPDTVDGRRPLAIAAESRSSRAPEMIKLLVKAHSQAARAPDANGQTALSIALESGKQWHEGVKTIFDAAPDMLTHRDAKTHLYPALMAASADVSDESSEEDETEMPNEQCEEAQANTAAALEPTTSTSLPTSSPRDEKASNWRSRVPPRVSTDNQSSIPELDPDSAQTSTIYEMVRADPSLVKW